MAETRKLDRSRTNRQMAGVCGGLAEYFNLDTTLIRICSSCWWLRPVLTWRCGSSSPTTSRLRR